MNIRNPFHMVDPFQKDIHENRSINRVIPSLNIRSQPDIVFKFHKLIENQNKEFLLKVKDLLEQALLRL
jgi:hypothetical protein